MALPTLAEAVEEIIDAIVDAITAEANTPGGGIEDVRAVLRGDRARPMPELPAVWVVPQAAQARQETYGNEEAWDLPVSIAALVKADTPAAGGKAAQRIAARAAAVAKDIRSGLDDYVVDVRMQSFDATARSSERNRTLYWTDATVRVTFTVAD